MSNGTLSVTPAIQNYINETGYREHDVLRQLREEMRSHPLSGLQIAPEQGALMQILIGLAGARNCIEIGTFTGYSALATALALPEEGKLICCDVSKEWTDIAQTHWKKAGVDHKIDLHVAPALETLDTLTPRSGEFDMVFIDADKGNYLEYYNRSVDLVRSGGLILIDNALWGGAVVKPETDDTRAIDQCNRYVFSDSRVEMVLLPIGDGLVMARKR